jgi:hypothetical protein
MYVDPRSMPGEPTAASYELLACEGIELNLVVMARVQALELGCHTAQAGGAAIVLRGNSRDDGRVSQLWSRQ